MRWSVKIVSLKYGLSGSCGACVEPYGDAESPQNYNFLQNGFD
jgi:hypothetical protein